MQLHKIILASFALAFSFPVLASTDCSNAQGTLVYHAYRYEGGPAPANGMLSSSETWLYNGQVFDATNYYVGGSVVDPALRVVVTEGSHKEIASRGINGVEQFWAEEKTLTRVDGNPVLPGRADKSIKEWFICYNETLMLP